MTTRIVPALLATIVLASAACDRDPRTSTCYDMMVPGVVIPAPPIRVTVRDAAGRGIAYGTTVVVRQTPADSNVRVGSDTTEIRAGAAMAGTFSLRVSKPFYVDTVIPHVVVNADECGRAAPTAVDVTLRRAPGAPPVRSLAIVGPSFLATPGEQLTLVPWLDADAGLSRAVAWRIADTTAATVDAGGVVTARCTTTGAADTVTAISVADTTVRAKHAVGVATQAHCS
jgi:hypothetical protein